MPICNAIRWARRGVVSRLTHNVTLEEIGAGGLARRFVESELIETTDILDLPLAPACQRLAVPNHRSRPGEATILHEPLYWPNQNLLLSAQRKVILSPNHGTIRPENLDPRPFLFHRSTRLEGLYTSLRSFRWSDYQTLVDQIPMLYVLGQMAAELDQPIQLVLSICHRCAPSKNTSFYHGYRLVWNYCHWNRV
ncbi:MAG: hypothetical protein P8N76_04675 [Pirellulaceae bacterium]|nr:hypothetical protein [Pirellulaceae bacterium]